MCGEADVASILKATILKAKGSQVHSTVVPPSPATVSSIVTVAQPVKEMNGWRSVIKVKIIN